MAPKNKYSLTVVSPMGRFLHHQGFRFSLKETVKAPKKRFGLPCYDKSICQVEHCKEVDEVLVHVRTIYRNPCDKDCERRINLKPISVTLCIKAKCEFFNPMGCYCQKYVDENKRRHKPKPFQFSKGLRTPSGGDRGFYGHKRLDGKGFV